VDSSPGDRNRRAAPPRRCRLPWPNGGAPPSPVWPDGPPRRVRRYVRLAQDHTDLRHGAATLAHAAGADLKDIQEMLGHSSITITADTYMSLLPEADPAIDEAAAWLVPRARATSDNTALEAEPEPDGTERPGVPDPVSRPEARCRDCSRSVSSGRSPNPPCGLHRNGLSTESAVRLCSCRSTARDWGSCCLGSGIG
jgi:hypothetical protein